MAVNPSSAFTASPDTWGGSWGGLTLLAGFKLELARLFIPGHSGFLAWELTVNFPCKNGGSKYSFIRCASLMSGCCCNMAERCLWCGLHQNDRVMLWVS